MASDSVARALAISALSSGGGSEPSSYLKDATVSGETLILTKKDDSTVSFVDHDTVYTAGSNVQISDANVISATDTTYTAGNNVSISNGVISATDTTYSDATTSASGLMSSTDKTKLNGVATGATAVSVSASGSATDEIQYITINGTEKKIAGGGSGSSVEIDGKSLVKDAWGRLQTNSMGGYFDEPFERYMCASTLNQSITPVAGTAINMSNFGDKPTFTAQNTIYLYFDRYMNNTWQESSWGIQLSDGTDNNWVCEEWMFTISIDKTSYAGTFTPTSDFVQNYPQVRNINVAVQSMNMGRKTIPPQLIGMGDGITFKGTDGIYGNLMVNIDKTQLGFESQQQGTAKLKTLLGYEYGPSTTETEIKWTWRSGTDAAELNTGDKRVYIANPRGFNLSDIPVGGGFDLSFTWNDNTTSSCRITVTQADGTDDWCWVYGTVSNSQTTGHISFTDGQLIEMCLGWQGQGTAMLGLGRISSGWQGGESISTASLATAKMVVLEPIDSDFIDTDVIATKQFVTGIFSLNGTELSITTT